MAWTDKIKAYFAAAYVPGKGTQTISELVRTITRWWLEFTRNILVVATITFFAVQSDSWALKIFALIAIAALVLYATALSHHGHFNFFPYIKTPWLHRLINGFTWVALYVFLYVGGLQALIAIFASLKGFLSPR